MHSFLYGPPGVGKTTLGRALSSALAIPFIDLDADIIARAGMDIAQIFEREGEAAFRERELAALVEAVGGEPRVIALGGGALLDSRARAAAEQAGQVLCLGASLETLLTRLPDDRDRRPLLTGDPPARLGALLAKRSAHYDSFALRLLSDGLSVEEAVWQAQVRLGSFRVSGMGPPYDVRVRSGALSRLGEHLRVHGLKGPLVLVTDTNVGGHYRAQVEHVLRSADFEVMSLCLEPGETQKTVKSMGMLWEGFLRAGVERGSTILALGGGVIGDLTGFSAATFLRGVTWVNLPTSLLAMVDSSLGGKTGVDLPQGKNLVGAFYPPRMVIADPQVLATLPDNELRSGLAEVVKHGVIAAPDLFERCERGLGAVTANLDQIVRQGMAVKLRVIEADPYEKGLRQSLNLGHTIGHGVELASNYRLTHGESVAIGLVAEARLAEYLGLAPSGLADRIRAALTGLGLPTEIPGDMALDQVVQAMQHDKKRSAGKLHFALPVRIGEVRTGVVIEDWPSLLPKLAGR